MQSISSPSMSTPPGNVPHMPDAQAIQSSSSTAGSSSTFSGPLSSSRPSHGPPLNTSFRSSSEYTSQYGNYPSPAYNPGNGSQGPVLPPFSSIAIGPSGSLQNNISPVRYHDNGRYNRHDASGSKRPAPSPSNTTSADSTDQEDEDDNGELPASGLVAPWEVLRGLADVAIQRAAKVRYLSGIQILFCTCPVHRKTETPTPANPKVERGLRLPRESQDPPSAGRFATRILAR
jgi:hypothetical protein